MLPVYYVYTNTISRTFVVLSITSDLCLLTFTDNPVPFLPYTIIPSKHLIIQLLYTYNYDNFQIKQLSLSDDNRKEIPK